MTHKKNDKTTNNLSRKKYVTKLLKVVLRSARHKLFPTWLQHSTQLSLFQCERNGAQCTFGGENLTNNHQKYTISRLKQVENTEK